MGNREEYLREGERLDDLQRNGYGIIQNPGKFCFGMDAVLLSGFVRVGKGESVLDLGTGTGILPILLEARTEGARFVGLEIQEEVADMAARSVAMNGLGEKVRIVTGDIRDAASRFGTGSFDVVTSNPPYLSGDGGLKNADLSRTIARHEVLCSLEDVISQGAKVLRERGRLFLVHRPFRLAEIFSLMARHRLEPKRMRLVYPYVDREPNMVLVEGVKGGRPRLAVERPLIVFKEPGAYSDEIREQFGY